MLDLSFWFSGSVWSIFRGCTHRFNSLYYSGSGMLPRMRNQGNFRVAALKIRPSNSDFSFAYPCMLPYFACWNCRVWSPTIRPKKNPEFLYLFVKFHAGNEVVLPWNNSPAVQVTHSQWTHAQCIEAADVAALVAGATNHMADTFNLPVGGYAYYGTYVCAVVKNHPGHWLHFFYLFSENF